MGKGDLLTSKAMVNQRKRDIVNRLCECFSKYKQIVVVSLDNVSTNQIHAARAILQQGEHKGEMIIGKNTLIKKALKFKTEAPNPSSEDYEDHKRHTQDPRLAALVPLMKLNVGLIFSEEPYMDLRVKVEAEKIKMPARTGVPAPCNVILPVGPTGVEVSKIDLFHKLNIQCKTVKSAIEINKEVQIITKGEKVTEGATQMCKLLQIVPFEYSLTFQYVSIDGVVLDQSIIEMPLENITDAFEQYAGFLTALSLGADIPNALSVPHFIGNAFKTLLAIGSESGYEFAELRNALDASKNAAPVQATSAPAGGAKQEEKKEAAPAEEDDASSEGYDLDALF